ncbi:hypothetical protein ACVMB3_000288 [Sinorhizobium meliloti]|uniref:hypothetical protein n=1 Tax=Sinorhizobium medicae TaxID=110321 RepID=UPI000C7C5C9A|nr:hypothetical protein [Sinorhizobium medicae]MDX0893205.1 hypothetical protein [Sinorhizobium medicae]PLU42324.1 hypothetical protein BMJ25_30190 [Sinorhizobium medicae]RVQ46921.1 hypothetical protein CN059_16330 [Sinorhizobium medicae]
MLYDRVINTGTINEPGGKPTPEYALQSTVSWMRSLQFLTRAINFTTATAAYQTLGKRDMDVLVENTVLEQLFLALHHLSALQAMEGAPLQADVARLGILGWYYGISNAASAMTAAQDGSFQEDHSGTARMWDTAIAAQGLAIGPFGWRVTTLIEKDYATEVEIYRNGSEGSLQWAIASDAEAVGAAASYLKGSAKWHAWKQEQALRNTREFKALQVDNFRTKAAREMRDARLAGRPMGFVHQASRYRGKANYREALFLAYGKGTEKTLRGFVSDQTAVLRAFLAMAGAFCARKLGRQTWDEFVADVEANRAFAADVSVWS